MPIDCLLLVVSLVMGILYFIFGYDLSIAAAQSQYAENFLAGLDRARTLTPEIGRATYFPLACSQLPYSVEGVLVAYDFALVARLVGF